MQSTVERMLYLTILILFIGLSLAVGILYSQIQNQAKLSAEIHQAVIELKADKAVRDKTIIDHIDCIGLFLSQPNRAEARIADLQNCKISPK